MNKNCFDFIRFTLSFIVVLRHIIDLSDNYLLSPFEHFLDSYVSVTGFFIISGFLIIKSYNRTANTKDYFVKRMRRLLPAYILSVVGGALILSMFSTYSIELYFKDGGFYKYLFSNIIFLNFLKPCLPGLFIHNSQCAVNGALWTIKVEILFYIVVPVIAYYINRMSRKYLLLLFIYILSIIYKLSLEHGASNLSMILSRQLPGFLSYFAVGISFYYYHGFYMKNRYKLFFVSVCVFALEYYFNLEILRPVALGNMIFFIAYSFPKLNAFGKYGDFSYGIYIFHFPIIQIFVQYGFFDRHNPFLVSAAIVILVIFIAILSWRMIESPFLLRNLKLPNI